MVRCVFSTSCACLDLGLYKFLPLGEMDLLTCLRVTCYLLTPVSELRETFVACGVHVALVLCGKECEVALA